MKKHIFFLIVLILLLVIVASVSKPYKPIDSTPSPTPTTEPVTSDLIRVTSPQPGATTTSPITITGEARGTWYFEASFPIVITDWDGRIIGEGHAEAQGDWMTENFVPFKAVVSYTNATSTYSNRGTIILKKDNPSGLPEHDASIEIPVILN